MQSQFTSLAIPRKIIRMHNRVACILRYLVNIYVAATNFKRILRMGKLKSITGLSTTLLNIAINIILFKS